MLLFADERERRLQARDADREAGCRNFLACEARDEIVVAAAAADRAEADGLAVIAFDLERQLGFEDGTGVVFEAADDDEVYANSPIVVTGRGVSMCSRIRSKLSKPLVAEIRYYSIASVCVSR